MALKVAFNIDDALLESGIAQGRAAYNATVPVPIDNDADYAALQALEAMEQFRGAGKRALGAKIEQLRAEDIADVVAVVDAKIAAAVEVIPLADPVVEVKP